MDVYIIRIYRREKDNPANVIGVVEKPGEPQGETFANAEELWEILSRGKRAGRKKINWDIDKL